MIYFFFLRGEWSDPVNKRNDDFFCGSGLSDPLNEMIYFFLRDGWSDPHNERDEGRIVLVALNEMIYFFSERWMV